MALDLRLQHKMTQQLAMTPQLQQAIKLLTLSHLELAELIRDEIAENPVLEEAEPGDRPGDEAVDPLIAPSAVPEAADAGDRNGQDGAHEIAGEPSAAEVDWAPEAALTGEFTRGHTGGDEGPSSMEATLVTPTSLVEHLRWQVRMADLTAVQRQVALFLAEEIGDDGYLSADAVALAAAEFDVDAAEAQAVLAVLQEFDPPGVAATCLQECLAIQARAWSSPEPLVAQIIDGYLPYVERRALPQVARALHVTLAEVQRAVRLISHLEPRPGRNFHGNTTQYITPDIYVHRVGPNPDDYAITLNGEGLPRVRIGELYAAGPQAHFDGPTQGYVQEKLRAASWLIRSIQMRQRTMYRVMQSILSFQRDFFDQGEGHLKPLILRDVALDVGMHESTISRVTTNKYVHTPQGIKPLKFFFNSTISGTSGESLASQSVRSHIQRLVGAEPPEAPLSDQRLVELLRQKDIDIARRTVAKYREMLKIPPSSRRRRVF